MIVRIEYVLSHINEMCSDAFGYTNTHATFHYVLHAILSPYLDRFVLDCVDDILLYSKSYEELF